LWNFINFVAEFGKICCGKTVALHIKNKMMECAEYYQHPVELLIDLKMKSEEKSLNCCKFPVHVNGTNNITVQLGQELRQQSIKKISIPLSTAVK